MTHKNPDILDRHIVAESRLFRVEEVHLRFSNGEERHYERVIGRAKDSVLVVPLLDEDTFLLIREYGNGIGEYTLGFPKGAVDAGEAIDVSAERELKEEVGYGAKSLTHITQVSASPGYMGSIMQVYVARDLYPERLEGDEPEPLDVVEWKFNNIDALLAHPEFNEARSIAALLLVARELNI